jgi:hypothetical protein
MKKSKTKPRVGPWKKWDILQEQLRPLQKRYAKAAMREALAIFGDDCFKPPIRMGVLEWIDPRFAVVLEMAFFEPPQKLKRRVK